VLSICNHAVVSPYQNASFHTLSASLPVQTYTHWVAQARRERAHWRMRNNGEHQRHEMLEVLADRFRAALPQHSGEPNE